MRESEIIDLKLFCDPVKEREFFQRPFVKSGFKIATNGVICVRIPSEESDTPDIDYPGDKLIFEKAQRITPVQWPNTPLIDASPDECTHCRGTGHEIRCSCINCDGEGEFEDGSDCETCEGRGWLIAPPLCPTCNGSRNKLLRNVCGVNIDHRYERWILTLPNVRVVGLISLPTSKANQSGLVFEFDGGDGAIMGVSRIETSALAKAAPSGEGNGG